MKAFRLLETTGCLGWGNLEMPVFFRTQLNEWFCTSLQVGGAKQRLLLFRPEPRWETPGCTGHRQVCSLFTKPAITVFYLSRLLNQVSGLHVFDLKRLACMSHLWWCINLSNYRGFLTEQIPKRGKASPRVQDYSIVGWGFGQGKAAQRERLPAFCTSGAAFATDESQSLYASMWTVNRPSGMCCIIHPQSGVGMRSHTGYLIDCCPPFRFPLAASAQCRPVLLLCHVFHLLLASMQQNPVAAPLSCLGLGQFEYLTR